MLANIVGLLLLLQAIISNGVELKNPKVIAFLKETSDPDVIPLTEHDDEPLTVDVGLSLMALREVDRERNEIEIVAWLKMFWENKALSWDLDKQGFNVTSVNIHRGNLWSPDLSFYNEVKTPEVTTPDIASVTHSGSVSWFRNMVIRTTCDLANIESEEGVSCTLIIGSWTYNGYQVRLTNSTGADRGEYNKHPKYGVTSISSEVLTNYYPCCPEPYMQLDVKLQIIAKSQCKR